MEYCDECNCVEAGFAHVVTDDEEYFECKACGSVDSRKCVDEDYGQDR